MDCVVPGVWFFIAGVTFVLSASTQQKIDFPFEDDRDKLETRLTPNTEREEQL